MGRNDISDVEDPSGMSKECEHMFEAPLFHLADGRRVILKEYYQQLTYSTLFEGEPDEMLNTELTTDFRSYSGLFKTRVASDTEYFVPWSTKLIKGNPYLPAVFCCGLFYLWGTAANPFGNILIVKWFQGSQSPIVVESVIDHLKGIDWDKIAAPCGEP